MTYDAIGSAALDIRAYRDAVAVPFGAGRRRGTRRPAGIFDADGSYVDAAQCFRSDRLPTTIQPEGGAPVDDMRLLPGRWVFGGMLYQHFGHFLIESTSRLWVLDHIEGPVDGLLFFPRKQATWEDRYVRPVKPWLGQFGADLPEVLAPKTPVRVEELVVAPQGFGAGGLMAGTPAYRDFVQAHLGRSIAADGAEKIYISRTGLTSKRGRYLGEAQIEAQFQAEGYRVFHPQAHSLEEQIAQYKAAKVVVSSDNSALHLAAFFTGPEDRVAIILRRAGNLVGDFQLQFRSFAGCEPDVVDVMDGRAFQPSGSGAAQMSEIYTTLDLPRLGAWLAEAGYVGDATAWQALTAPHIEEELARYQTALGRPIEPRAL